MYFVVFVAALAVIVSVLLIPDVQITGKSIKLGNTDYDVKVITTPVVTGKALEAFSYVATRTRLGPFIRRYLINDNHVEIIRELAAQITLPPMYFPMRRVGKERLYALNEEESDKQLSEVIQQGVDRGQYSGSAVGRSAEEYAAYYRSGKGLPSEVMRRTLETIHNWEKQGYVIFSTLHDDMVMAQAKESDERFRAGKPLSILDGVPIAFKDMMSLAGHIAYSGHDPNPKYSEFWYHGKEDDTMVKRFRAMGAIIMGLTIQVEGGVTPMGYNAHWKGPFSPYSWNRYPGGSSSGSGVVVGTGIVPIAIGFDGGGSVRSPSALSGIHGLAVGFGRVPFDTHLDSVLIKAGPMTATAGDAAIAYSVMAKNSPGSFYNVMYDGDVHGPPHPQLDGLYQIEDLSDVKLGIYKAWFDDSDEKVRKRCYEVVDFLKSKGATVVEIEIPHLQAVAIAHGMKISTEFAVSWDKVWGNAPESIEPNTLITLGIGTSGTPVEILAGEKLRAWMFKYVTDLFAKEKLTAIINPTIGIEAPILTEETKVAGESNTALSVRVMKYLAWVNFLGLPGYSVPVGYIEPSNLHPNEPKDTKLPVGFQFVSDHWTEHQLLRLARAVEYGFTSKLPKAKPIFYFDPLDA